MDICTRLFIYWMFPPPSQMYIYIFETCTKRYKNESVLNHLRQVPRAVIQLNCYHRKGKWHFPHIPILLFIPFMFPPCMVSLLLSPTLAVSFGAYWNVAGLSGLNYLWTRTWYVSCRQEWMPPFGRDANTYIEKVEGMKKRGQNVYF